MTPEEYADSIAKWTNEGLRQAIIDAIAAAVAEMQERCAKVADERFDSDDVEETTLAQQIAAAIRALK